MYLRVLVDSLATGAWNMAVDEALLATAGPSSEWTLRFYGWRCPTVSLGYAQPFEQGVAEEVARRNGVDVVRRLTGGRAVLHADELTYSLTAPTGYGPLAVGVAASYLLIASGLCRGLLAIGADVDLERTAPSPARGERGPCFSTRARYELLAGGRKLIGSAQRRRGGRLLQHGSMPLGRPDLRLWQALGRGHQEAAAASVGLAEVLRGRPARRALVGYLARGMGEALGLPLRRDTLSRAELRRAAALSSRYRSATWTRRR